MNVEFILRGTSALLHHNPRMVDPEDEYNRAMKEISGKKKKTDADLSGMAEIEWHGGIYTADIDGKSVVSQPSSKVRKCLIQAARITKQGKGIERSVIMSHLHLPLIYDGSDKATDHKTELVRLFKNPAHHSRLSVGIGQKRVMRVRPQFHPWALIVPAIFVEDAGLNFDELARIVELAGITERIGDNRVNGYGAFRGHVREVKAGTKPIKPSVAGVSDFFDGLDKRGAA